MPDTMREENMLVKSGQSSRELINRSMRGSELASALMQSSQQQISPVDLHTSLVIDVAGMPGMAWLFKSAPGSCGFIHNTVTTSKDAVRKAIDCKASLVLLIAKEPYANSCDLEAIRKMRKSLFPCEIIVLAYMGQANIPEVVWKYINAGADIVWGGDVRHALVSLVDAYPRIRKIKRFLIQSSRDEDGIRPIDIDENGLSLKMVFFGKSGVCLTKQNLNEQIFFSFSELYDLAEFMYKHGPNRLDYQELIETNTTLRLECWATSWTSPGYRSGFVTQECACGWVAKDSKIEEAFCGQCDRTLFRPSFFQSIPGYKIRVRLKRRGVIGEYGETSSSFCMNDYAIDSPLTDDDLFRVSEKRTGNTVFQISPHSLPAIIAFINQDMVSFANISKSV